MKANEHMRYEQYIEFIESKGLVSNLILMAMTAENIEQQMQKNDFAIEFGFWIWLKVVEQSEQLLRQAEACTDVHQC